MSENLMVRTLTGFFVKAPFHRHIHVQDPSAREAHEVVMRFRVPVKPTLRRAEVQLDYFAGLLQHA